ncbi:hypothetical protein ATANTOWER_032469 [Ataeniobius toweri]|uniref:Uncharacterized protein n=1 Tax=Ataeniobius toweri TaxID=208326 RepID=A0ABU7BV83_9TELE|nr:hypothetical protein [Ataeniobius toweri]
MGRKTRGKLQQTTELQHEMLDEDSNTSNKSEHEVMEAIQASIIAFIQASRVEVKTDFTKTMDLLRKELGGFSTRDGWKAKQNGCRDERNHRGWQRVVDMEDLNTERIEALARSLQLRR